VRVTFTDFRSFYRADFEDKKAHDDYLRGYELLSNHFAKYL
jgi:hypothetical protein